MKKIWFILMLLMIFPIKTMAFTGSVSVVCSPNEVRMGDALSCKVSATTDSKVTAIEMKFAHDNGVTVQSFTTASSWSGSIEGENKIKVTGEHEAGTFEIGTLNLKVNENSSAGESTLSLSEILINNEHTASNTNSKFKIISNAPTKGLRSLSVTGGVLGPQFNNGNYSYQLVVESDTINIEAIAANSSDTITYSKGENKEIINPTGIKFEATNDQGVMLINIDVGSGENATNYMIMAFKETTEVDNQSVLSSLTVGGKKITLEKDKYDYTVTLDNVSSYSVQATLSDSAKYAFDDYLVPPVTLSGENEFVLIINPKDTSSGLSTVTYTINVKKKTTGTTGGTTNGGGNSNQNVTNNPQTSDISAFIMAIILVSSLVVSISLYKKNLNGYN